MPYCKNGDKPTVKYKFGTGGFRIFKAEISPIDVKQKEAPIPSTSDYNNEGFGVRAAIYNYSEPTITLTVRDYKVTDIRPDQPFYGGSNRYVYFQNCDEEKINEDISYALDMSTFEILDNTKCSNSKDKRCSLQVFDSEGNMIFQDQGDCPCEFEVQCGNCPENTIECKTSHYPGYCCIPCVPTANKIDNLSNSIRLL